VGTALINRRQLPIQLYIFYVHPLRKGFDDFHFTTPNVGPRTGVNISFILPFPGGRRRAHRQVTRNASIAFDLRLKVAAAHDCYYCYYYITTRYHKLNFIIIGRCNNTIIGIIIISDIYLLRRIRLTCLDRIGSSDEMCETTAHKQNSEFTI